VSKFACCIQTQLSVRCMISVLVGRGLLILRNAISELFLIIRSNKIILQTPCLLTGVLEIFSAESDYLECSFPTSQPEENKIKPLFTVISVLFSVIRFRNW
jgi:hypothetical protein